MESKICLQCKIEKHMNNFLQKFSECKDCNSKRGLKRYYANKDKMSNQQKNYYETNRDNLLQKQNNRFMNFKQLHRPYAELQNRLKAMEEKLSKNDSENN